MVFLTKERPILTVLKQMILYEIKQSNGIKPQQIYFFMIFCKFLPHKGTFCWKVLSKNINTFYLKHQKYPFCAPIFHPLSETESYAGFTNWAPLGRVGHRAAMSVCLSVCVFAPSCAVCFEASHWPSDHMIRFRPLIGRPPPPLSL